MIDVADAEVQRILEYLAQGTHVVAVGMGHKPCLHLAAQGSDEASEGELFTPLPAVHHYHFARGRAKNITVADVVAEGGQLPHCELGFFARQPFPCEVPCGCSGLYAHSTGGHER